MTTELVTAGAGGVHGATALGCAVEVGIVSADGPLTSPNKQRASSFEVSRALNPGSPGGGRDPGIGYGRGGAAFGGRGHGQMGRGQSRIPGRTRGGARASERVADGENGVPSQSVERRARGHGQDGQVEEEPVSNAARNRHHGRNKRSGKGKRGMEGPRKAACADESTSRGGFRSHHAQPKPARAPDSGTISTALRNHAGKRVLAEPTTPLKKGALDLPCQGRTPSQRPWAPGRAWGGAPSHFVVSCYFGGVACKSQSAWPPSAHTYTHARYL